MRYNSRISKRRLSPKQNRKQAQIQQLQQQIAQQQEELLALRSALTALSMRTSELPDGPSEGEQQVQATTHTGRKSRRTLLRWSTTAAISGVAAAIGVEALSASRARAADGDAIVLGMNNYAGRTTYLKPMFADRPPDTLVSLSGAQTPLISQGYQVGLSGLGASVGVNGTGNNIGVYGTSPNSDSTGVKGEVSGSGYGLFAHAGAKGVGAYAETGDLGIAVHAVVTDGSGIAVKGEIPGQGSALTGYAGNGIGVNAEVAGDGVGARLAVNSNTAVHLQLIPSSTDSHPDSAAPGTLYVDRNKRLWYCNGDHWTQLA